MSDFQDAEFKKLFFEDTDKILKNFKVDFPLLKSPERQKEALKNIHRYAHSLKGLSAAVGFEDIRLISEKFEDSLKEYINKEPLSLPENLTREIDNAFKNIEQLLSNKKDL